MTERPQPAPGLAPDQPTAGGASGLGAIVETRIRQALGAVPPEGLGEAPIALDRLRVRVPAGAREADVADAIARAVVKAVQRRRR